MDINFKNVEELIFYNSKIHLLFPELRHIFDQWKIGQTIPGMKSLAQRSVLELLELLDTNKIKKLEEFFKESVFVDKINYQIVKNHDFSLDEFETLCQFSEYKDFCVTQENDKLSITFWR